ncbi:hypothetical protein GMB80_13755 [Turicibacter sanguinis]|nr:hypothetical protein [Turicibacter sanguinis]
MEEEKIINIKVQTDSSKTEKAFKDVAKTSEQMTNRVEHSNKRVNQSFTGVESQVKDTAAQMQKAFQKVNMSGLIKSMNKIKQTVSQSMQRVKSQMKLSDLTSEMGNIRTLQVKLETSKAKEDAIALGNALVSLEQKAKKAGVNLASLNGIQKANNVVAESSTKLTNAQRQAMLTYSHLAISELRKVQSEQGKIGKVINTVTSVYKKSSAQITNVIDKIKKKIIQWKNNHVSTTKSIQKANKTLTSSFKSVLSAIAPFASLYVIFAGLKKAINDAMESIETDNMFNTVMGSSSKEMNAWVKELNRTVGLGITNTKQYTATITQMGRAMGLTGQQAINMSKQMAVMAGDISSFYNTDLASVQADLRSALSGSYETMDKYGIVLRATTIQQYAYANGIAQTGADLTNAQRAMATTMMIEEQLGLANGDLARSLKSPSNQARILKSNLSDLSIALGKCFTPVLTVVLPILNTFVQALTTTINSIATFISQVFTLFGVEVDFGVGGVINDITGSLEDADISSGGVSDNLADGAESAKKIAKSLSGIDELNILSDNTSSSNGSTGSTGSSSGGIGGIDFAETSNSAVNSISTKLEELRNRFKDFMAGFNTTFDASIFNEITKHLHSLRDTMIEIFSDEDVKNSANRVLRQWSMTFGAYVGTMATIGTQLASAFVGGYDTFLSQNKEYIRESIIGIFDLYSEIAVEVRKMLYGVSTIFKAFGSDEGKQLVANIINGIFSVSFEVTELGLKLGRDLIHGIAQPIYDNATEIKQALETTFGFIASIIGITVENVRAILSSFNQFYDEHIKPFVDSFVNGVSEILNTLLEGYNTYMKPTFDSIGDNFSRMWSEYIQPAIENILNALGKLFDALNDLWTDVLQPLINWIAQYIFPVVAPIIDMVVRVVLDGIGAMIKIIGDIIAWIIDFVASVVQMAADVGKAFVEMKDWVVETITNLVQGIRNLWENAKTTVINKCTEIKNGIKQKFTDAYTTVKTIFDNIKNSIKEKIEWAKNKVEGAVDAIKNVFNFEWSLPKLKLPHFKVSGEFSLNPLSVPSFGIEWYRSGGILPAGSNAIFGMNGNNLMAGGEISTGGEAILPLSDLFNEMRGMFATQNQQLISQLRGNNAPVTLTLNVDGRQLGKITFDNILKLAQTGSIDTSLL